MRNVLLTGEETQKWPAFLADMVADCAAQAVQFMPGFSAILSLKQSRVFNSSQNNVRISQRRFARAYQHSDLAHLALLNSRTII